MSKRFTKDDRITTNQSDPTSGYFVTLKQHLLQLSSMLAQNQIQVIDILLYEIYEDHLSLRDMYTQANQKLSKTLKDFSQVLESCKADRTNIYNYNADRQILMQKLRNSTDSELNLLKQNQALYEALNKMEEINTMTTQKVNILQLTIQKQRILHKQDLDYEKTKNNIYTASQNQMRSNFNNMKNDYNNLIESNQQIQNEIQNLRLETVNKKTIPNKSRQYLLLFCLIKTLGTQTIEPIVQKQLPEFFPDIKKVNKYQLKGMLNQHMIDGLEDYPF